MHFSRYPRGVKKVYHSTENIVHDVNKAGIDIYFCSLSFPLVHQIKETNSFNILSSLKRSMTFYSFSSLTVLICLVFYDIKC